MPNTGELLVGQSPTTWTADSNVFTVDQTNITADGSIIGPLMRVQAVQRGFYNGLFRDVGDVFDIYATGDYSNSTVNYGSVATPLYGWMKQVPNSTPLYTFSLNNGGASTPVQGTYGINSQGAKNLSIPTYVV